MSSKANQPTEKTSTPSLTDVRRKHSSLRVKTTLACFLILLACVLATFFCLDTLYRNNMPPPEHYPQIFGILLVVVCIGTTFIYLGIRAIARDIEKLKIASHQIAMGEFGTRLPVIERSDELGDLADSFERMRKAIHKNRLQFEKHSHELEEKIQHRTRQMQEIQQQLVQAGKLAAVGELSAGIAHELNNPIGGILGYTQFLHEKMKERAAQGDASSVFFSKYMEFIARESQRCKQIIRNLLKFSRSSSLEMSKIDINVVLADTIGIVTNQMKLEKIQIRTDYQNQLPLVSGDPNQLQQVFMNTFLNATKAIPEERIGEIAVRTSMITRDTGPFVEIRISDNGCGIPATDLDKIFDPFFTTRPPGEGTGLGLSLSYGIVKEHRGEILVESKLGVGSTFRILLPCSEPTS